MLDTFCAGANIKAFMRQTGCPSALRQLAPILDSCFESDARGTLMTELRSTDAARSLTLIDNEQDWRRWQDIDALVKDAMKVQESNIQEDIPGFIAATRALPYPRVSVGGVTYSTAKDGDSGCTIFFRSTSHSDRFVPGVIRQILATSVPQTSSTHHSLCILFVVHRFLPSSPLASDPFAQYPEFGASIWSRELSSDIDITPAIRGVHHAMRAPWTNDTYVLKSVAKVSTHSTISPVPLLIENTGVLMFIIYAATRLRVLCVLRACIYVSKSHVSMCLLFERAPRYLILR